MKVLALISRDYQNKIIKASLDEYLTFLKRNFIRKIILTSFSQKRLVRYENPLPPPSRMFGEKIKQMPSFFNQEPPKGIAMHRGL